MAVEQAGRWIAAAAIGIASLGLATGAQARDVVWSVGVGAPGAQVIVGNAPVYVAPPVIVQAPPRYYRPPPAVYHAPPVYYMPPPRVYYQPQPIYYGPPAHFRGHRHGRGHGHGHGHHRDRDWRR
jgi:hypothetical protein